jgi:small subunit ribosomal protein S18
MGDRPMGDRPMGDRPMGDRPMGDRPMGERGPRRGGREKGYGRGKYPRRKVCNFCVDKVKFIDYKDSGRLRRHLTERAKIESRRKTGTCAKHQRALALAIKRARYVALLPFTAEHIRLSGFAMRG